MSSLTQEEINVDLFDEVQRLKEENSQLTTERDVVIDSLAKVVNQFELSISNKPATNAIESLAYAHSLLEKYHDSYVKK